MEFNAKDYSRFNYMVMKAAVHDVQFDVTTEYKDPVATKLYQSFKKIVKQFLIDQKNEKT